MVHITDIYELKSKLNKLKHQLNKEPKSYQEKELANKYLNKVFDYLDELKLF
jgi:predicted DNA-binding protein